MTVATVGAHPTRVNLHTRCEEVLEHIRDHALGVLEGSLRQELVRLQQEHEETMQRLRRLEHQIHIDALAQEHDRDDQDEEKDGENDESKEPFQGSVYQQAEKKELELVRASIERQMVHCRVHSRAHQRLKAVHSKREAILRSGMSYGLEEQAELADMLESNREGLENIVRDTEERRERVMCGIEIDLIPKADVIDGAERQMAWWELECRAAQAQAEDSPEEKRTPPAWVSPSEDNPTGSVTPLGLADPSNMDVASKKLLDPSKVYAVVVRSDAGFADGDETVAASRPSTHASGRSRRMTSRASSRRSGRPQANAWAELQADLVQRNVPVQHPFSGMGLIPLVWKAPPSRSIASVRFAADREAAEDAEVAPDAEVELAEPVSDAAAGKKAAAAGGKGKKGGKK